MVIAGHRLVGGASRNNPTVHPGQLTWHHDRRFQARRMSLMKQNARRVDVYNRGRENKLDRRESFKSPNVKMSKSRKYRDKFGRCFIRVLWLLHTVMSGEFVSICDATASFSLSVSTILYLIRDPPKLHELQAPKT